MTATHQPPELLKYASHEYLVYEVADHVEAPHSTIGVILERHGASKFAIYCTGSFVDGKLTEVHTPASALAESDEERMMLRLFDHSPELQTFVRNWIEHCYRRYETEGGQIRRPDKLT
jgi:hypothetical protein